MTRGPAAAFGRLTTGGGGAPSNFHRRRRRGLLGQQRHQQSVNFRAGKNLGFFGKKFLGFKVFKDYRLVYKKDQTQNSDLVTKRTSHTTFSLSRRFL